MSILETILPLISALALVYFAGLALSYGIFTLLAWHELAAHRRMRAYAPLDEIYGSPFTPPVSVLLPAYNEQAGVVASVRSLLDLRYERHELIVVNDGSTDGTLERLREAYDLAPVRKAMRSRIATAPIRAAYVSRTDPNLWVLDKENGGKADALNAGVNAAVYAHVCAIDADAVLEQDSLLRIVKPFFDDPELVAAAGGIIRIANGCTIQSGRVVSFGLPRSRLACFQLVEYFRAFLIGRIGFDAFNGTFVVSGAFGLFRRELVEAVGGYAHDTVGEDVELVARLHRHLRRRGEPYRIRFVPDPVCWTEVPEDIATLQGQRRRWQRGLGETLWRHRRQIGNPRAGAFGMITLPFFLVFEFLGALIELVGIPVVILAALLGLLSLPFFLSFLAVSVLTSLLLSIAAIMLEEFAVRRFDRARQITRLVIYGLLENFGYRQLIAYFQCRGGIDLVRRRHDWGEMPRRGLERPAEAPIEPTPPKVRGLR
jgi:cellulose synthase/poly-beta-1,6-N-acetylglucosamine synthase-like glycosyltransferase